MPHVYRCASAHQRTIWGHLGAAIIARMWCGETTGGGGQSDHELGDMLPGGAGEDNVQLGEYEEDTDAALHVELIVKPVS